MTNRLNIRSEKGVALIVVLLLLGVMAALTTGLALSGQSEVQMAANETYYAGARAAAEAGMNRAVAQIVANTNLNLLQTKSVPNIGNGPFALNSQYNYRYEILDDDDAALYPTWDAATLAAKVAQQPMLENGNPNVNTNTRMILRAIGTGPKGTTVIVSRILNSTEIPDLPKIKNVVTNPALLVNGDLTIGGSAVIQGLRGNVHANGNIAGNGNPTVTGDITATGTVDPGLHPGGLKAGNMPGVAIPEIKAQDYENLADFKLLSGGGIQARNAAGNWVPCTASGSTKCPSGWTPPAVAGGAWTASGSMPDTATYYVEGPVEMHGTGKSSFTKLSLIAEGSITLTGNGKFKPENGAGIQFVTNGDFELSGTVDADDSVDMDGQIMVREQIKILGNSEFQGRVMVENRDGATNALRKGASTLSANEVQGNMTLTYNGQLGDITTTITLPPGPSTYTNNISGWIEQ